MGDNSIGDVAITVEGAGSAMLSDPGQGVCGVTFSFDHEYIGDMTFTLTSPFGQTVTLIGPVGFFGATDGAIWDISFVPCSATANPDLGMSPTFTNSDDWEVNGTYTGSYYPNSGCLEDFNSGPLNGDWILHWYDGQAADEGNIYDFNIIFCDPPSTIICCLSEGGELSPSNVVSECYGSPALYNVVSAYWVGADAEPDTLEYGYTYIVVANGLIVGLEPDADLSSYFPGTYQICGLSYLLADSLNLPQIGDNYTNFLNSLSFDPPLLCGDLSGSCTMINIYPPETVEFDSVPVLCLTDSLYALSATPAGGTFTGPGVTGNTFNPSFFTENDTVKIVYQASGQFGCPAIDTLTIIVIDCGCQFGPIADPGQDQSICVGSPTIYLDGGLYGSATAGTWVGGAGIFTPSNLDVHATYTPTAAELAGDSLVLTLITNDPDGSGICVPDTASVTISFVEVAIQSVTMANGKIDCNIPKDTLIGSATVSNGENLFTYWKDAMGNIIQLGDTLIIGNVGSYTYFAESAEGCVESSSVYLNGFFNVPDIQFDEPGIINCDNPTITLTGSSGTNNAQLVWVGPGLVDSVFTDNVTIAEGGYYSLTVIDPSNGCKAFLPKFVAVDTLFPVITYSTSTLSCLDTLVDIVVNSGGIDYDYAWIFPDGVTTDTLQSLYDLTQIGDYLLNIKNMNSGCELDTTITVNDDIVAPNVTVSSFPTDAMINCDNATVNLVATSTTAGVAFEWNGPSVVKDPDQEILVATPGTYLLKVIGSNGCESLDSIIVYIDTIAPPMDNPVSSDTITCYTSSSTLTISSVSAMVNFTWYNNNGVILGTGNSMVALNPGGYMVVAKDPINGCTSMRSLDVESDIDAPLAILNVNGEITCSNLSVLVDLSVNRDLDSISWSGLSLNEQDTMSVTVNEAGTYQVYFVGDNGCIGSEDFDVSEDITAPIANASAQFEVTCIRKQGGLSIAGSSVGSDFSYSWSALDGAIVSGENSSEPVVEGPGEFVLLVVDISNGCVGMDSITLYENLNVPTDIKYSTLAASCNNQVDGAIVIDGAVGGVKPIKYKLNNGAFSAQVIYSPLSPGNYTISAEDENGCIVDIPVLVDQPIPLSLDLGPDQLVRLGDYVTINGIASNLTGVDTIVWNTILDTACLSDPLCLSQSFYPLKSIILKASIIDRLGCTTSDEIEVIVDDAPEIFVPNIFSPNGDMKNDLFTVYKGDNVAKVFDLTVFDRWGNKHYFVSEIETGTGWDGTFRGEISPDGVYVYQFLATLWNGETKVYSGSVTLIR